MGTLEPWKPCLPLILSPNNLRALFSIILFPVPLLLAFHLGSLHLFVSHYHLFVLSPFIPSPCFPSSCLPSFCGPFYVIPIIIFSSCLPSSLHLGCPRASCLLVSCSPTSLCLVSDHPFVLSLSSLYFSPVCIPSYPLPSSLHPQQQTTLGFNLWKQSSRYWYKGLDPNFWLCTRVLIILFPIIPSSCLPSFCFVPSPAIPASPTTESSWVESLEAGGRFSHHPFISSVFIFCPFILSPFIWSLIVLSPHHPFILSPFMLSAFIFSPAIISLSCPPLPSSYFPASLHVVSAFPPICFS